MEDALGRSLSWADGLPSIPVMNGEPHRCPDMGAQPDHGCASTCGTGGNRSRWSGRLHLRGRGPRVLHAGVRRRRVQTLLDN